MTPEYLADLSREQLVPLIDLAPDIPGIRVHQRWMYREPKSRWQKLIWFMFGTPKRWRFEVVVLARPTWQYAVRDTLEEARKAAREANRKFSMLTTTVVTRSNVDRITKSIHSFLEHCYFTFVTNDWSPPSFDTWNHWRLRKPMGTGSPVYYELYEYWERYQMSPGYIYIYDVSAQYTLPVILQLDSTSFPRTLVTFEPCRLTLHIRQANDEQGTRDTTVIFVREGPIELQIGATDEHGTYRGE